MNNKDFFFGTLSIQFKEFPPQCLKAEIPSTRLKCKEFNRVDRIGLKQILTVEIIKTGMITRPALSFEAKQEQTTSFMCGSVLVCFERTSGAWKMLSDGERKSMRLSVWRRGKQLDYHLLLTGGRIIPGNYGVAGVCAGRWMALWWSW